MSQHQGPPASFRRLGKYEIRSEIGRGGMGVVYLGHDALLDRPVAIKVLAPHLVWEPGFVERFLREARTAARLKHAGIVAIYDVGQENNNYYIVMEYLAGRTLSDLVREQGPFSREQALAILQPLAAALDFAHQQGLVHRDVKPSNIVVHPGGHVTLTDFGVARAAQETRLTTTGALVGTPQYMSPEQARGDDVDHQTDIYSLGVVAYEMLAGRVPFDATTPHAVLHQVIYEPPRPLRGARPDLPPETEGVLAKALAKEKAGRYNTARDFVAALDNVLMGRPEAKALAIERSQAAKAQPRPPQPRKPGRADASSRMAVGARFGASWFLATALAWAIGWALGMPVGEVMGMAIGPVEQIAVIEIAIGAASGLVLGLAIGTAQALLLRRHLRAWEWLAATAVSMGVVGSLRWTQMILSERILDSTCQLLEASGWEELGIVSGITVLLLTEGLAGLLIGLAQWLAFQNRVPRAGRWVLVSTGAWAGAGLVVALVMTSLRLPDWDPAMMWIPPLLTGLVVAAITAGGVVPILSGTKKAQKKRI